MPRRMPAVYRTRTSAASETAVGTPRAARSTTAAPISSPELSSRWAGCVDAIEAMFGRTLETHKGVDRHSCEGQNDSIQGIVRPNLRVRHTKTTAVTGRRMRHTHHVPTGPAGPGAGLLLQLDALRAGHARCTGYTACGSVAQHAMDGVDDVSGLVSIMAVHDGAADDPRIPIPVQV
jgi:hypothetical protein